MVTENAVAPNCPNRNSTHGNNNTTGGTMLSLLLKKLMTLHSNVRGMDRDILYKGNILLSPSS
jgi:hypothetical protein